jgi:superfamily I DNA and/or RNA helicase
MPTHLVAETIAPKPGAFDVVIVDEASQSGLESAFLFWLGKKIIIVGDERQISPEAVGIDQTAAERYADTYLHDFQFRGLYSLGNSIFTLATVRFPGRVRLREHFRCMPEIIDFCNRVVYADAPLVPLRQYGGERLEPLVARYVEAGETRGPVGNTVNDREAEQLVALVATVVRLCRDPAYDGKTMGVISLLGSAQARLINDLLLRELPPEELAKRRLRCGDAYAFQGDERDVMFLSMVAGRRTGNGRFAATVAQRAHVPAALQRRRQSRTRPGMAVPQRDAP